MAVSRRPRRRPLAWLAAVVVATVLLLVVDGAVHSHPGNRERALAYADAVLPLIEESNNQGADLLDVRAKAVQLGREGIGRRLERLAAETGATLSSGSRIVAPPALRVAHAYLVAALGVRARAVAEARQALSAALAPGAPDLAVSGLATAGQDAELGDRAFALFTSSLPPATISPTPASVWIADGTSWAPPQLTAFITTLRSSTSLSPIHDLAIVTFTTDPAPVGNDNGAVVLPPARGLQVAIVIADEGNEAERHVTVTATLHTSSANTNESVRDFVDLAPGQTTAIQIGNLHPLSGTTGTLTVNVVPAPGETNLDNNTQTWSVELR